MRSNEANLDRLAARGLRFTRGDQPERGREFEQREIADVPGERGVSMRVPQYECLHQELDINDPARIVLGVQAPDIQGAIAQILSRVPPAELPASREAVQRAVLDREAVLSTYLGHGLASV